MRSSLDSAPSDAPLGHPCLSTRHCSWHAPVELGLELEGNAELQKAILVHHRSKRHPVCPWCRILYQEHDAHDTMKCRLFVLTRCPDNCGGGGDLVEDKKADETTRFKVDPLLPAIHAEFCEVAKLKKALASAQDEFERRRDVSDSRLSFDLRDQQPTSLDLASFTFILANLAPRFIGGNQSSRLDSSDNRSRLILPLLRALGGRQGAATLIARHEARLAPPGPLPRSSAAESKEEKKKKPTAAAAASQQPAPTQPPSFNAWAQPPPSLGGAGAGAGSGSSRAAPAAAPIVYNPVVALKCPYGNGRCMEVRASAEVMENHFRRAHSQEHLLALGKAEADAEVAAAAAAAAVKVEVKEEEEEPLSPLLV